MTEPTPVSLDSLLEGYGTDLARAGRGAEMRKKGGVAIKSLIVNVGHDDATKLTRLDVRK